MTNSIGRRAVLRAAVLFGLGGLAACAAFVPRSVEVSKEKLQESLAQRFPITRRIAEGLDLVAEVPVLSLQPESNRFAIDCSLAGQGGERLFGRPFSGVLALSSGLFFDAPTNSVRATDVRVERLHVEGLPAAFERGLERLVRPLAAAWLEQQPIYVLRERDLERLRAAGVAPGAIRVTAGGLSIELVPR